MNGNDKFLNINDAHLRVTGGNVHASSFNLDQISIATTSTTSSTIEFLNETKAFTARSNIEVGTANLFVDTTTSNVGIRTSSPEYALDVHGTANVSVLTAASNVGVLTTSPEYALDVHGTANVGVLTANTITGSGGTLLLGSHLIPTQHQQFDIGSAEYKIRHLYLSNNSLWIGDDSKISVVDGKMKFLKRNKNIVPSGTEDLGGNATDALAHAKISDPDLTNINQMKLGHWLAYTKSLTGGADKDIKDIFTDAIGNYEATSASDAFKEHGNDIYSVNKLRLGSAAAADATLDVVGTIKATSDLTVNTNTFHVDATNSRVGVGTTSPQEKLDVTGTAPYLSITDTRTSSGGTTGLDLGGIVFRTKDITDPSPETGDFLAKIQVTAQNAGSFPDGSLNFFVSDDGDLLSSPSMVIEGVTGNVGIGASIPDVKFQVEGTSSSHQKLTKLATWNIFHHRDDISFEHLITYTDSDGQAYFDNRDNFMYVQIPAVGGETLYTSTVSGYNSGYFNAKFRDLSGNKPNLAENTTYKVHAYSSRINASGYMTTAGRLGIRTADPACPFHVKFSTNAARSSGTRFEDANTTNYWENWINNSDYFYFAYNGSDRGWIQGPGGPAATKMPNFTGQHMTFIKDVPFSQAGDLEGLIVSSDQNKYIKMNGGIEAGSNAITINECLPVVSLSNVTNDKKCFGVISTSEDPETRTVLYGAWGSVAEKEAGDTRVYINSVGEGAIWVTNINGPLESGDYITTSNVAGYGMKQESEFLANYTVAKITMDCDFEPVTQPVQIIRKEMGDVNYWVNTTYENVSEEDYSNLEDENRQIIDGVYQKITSEESTTEQEGYELEVRQELVNVLDEHGQIQWEDDPSGATEKAYKIRYLDADGNITDEANHVHKAAFVGCTYHCG